MDANRTAGETMGNWHGPLRGAMVVLPKTQMTVALLSRWLKDPEGFSILAMMRGEMTGGGGLLQNADKAEMTRRIEADLDATSPWYIIGTSLLFEALVLTAACVVFIRRDF